MEVHALSIRLRQMLTFLLLKDLLKHIFLQDFLEVESLFFQELLLIKQLWRITAESSSMIRTHVQEI